MSICPTFCAYFYDELSSKDMAPISWMENGKNCSTLIRERRPIVFW